MNLGFLKKQKRSLPSSVRQAKHSKTLRVGVVGCGQVARHHLRFIAETENAELVGLADVNLESAERLGEMYGIRNLHSSPGGLLDSTPVDVLHIVTPPDCHYEQASEAIEKGVHVLIEKPLTLDPQQTAQLYEKASAGHVQICPDFIQLFHPLFQRAQEIIGSGDVGIPLHIESYWSLHSNLAEFSRTTKLHWSFSLPGGVLQNYLTHPLYQVLFWLGDLKKIDVSPKSFGTLPQGLTDHLHVNLEGRCTGSIVLSFASQRDAYYLQVVCERGVVLIDFYTSAVFVYPANRGLKVIDRGTFNLRRSWQCATAAARNAIDVVRGGVVPYQGLQRLIPAFYSSLRDRTPPPISPDLAKAVGHAEAEIFSKSGKLHLDTSVRLSRQIGIRHSEKVLVTGASGYIGSEVVKNLVAQGYYVRAFVRPLSRTASLEENGVELYYGDITDPISLGRAMDQIDIVIHLGTALKGPQDFVVRCAVEGTKNVGEIASQAGVKRVIYMSSMSVYDYNKLADGDTIDENSSLEERPEERGAYSLAKRKAEDLALSRLGDKEPVWTIVRPGQVVGKDNNILSPAGIKVGHFILVFGSPFKRLRLIDVEDVAAVCAGLIAKKASRGKIYTLSSGTEIQLRDYVDRCIRVHHPNLRPLYIPYWCCALFVGIIQKFHLVTGKGPNIGKRRLKYLYRDAKVDIRSIVKDVERQPKAILPSS